VTEIVTVYLVVGYTWWNYRKSDIKFSPRA